MNLQPSKYTTLEMPTTRACPIRHAAEHHQAAEKGVDGLPPYLQCHSENQGPALPMALHCTATCFCHALGM